MCEEVEKAAMKLRFGRERGQDCQGKKGLKHQRDRHVCNGKRERLEGFGCGGVCIDASSATLCAGESWMREEMEPGGGVSD